MLRASDPDFSKLTRRPEPLRSLSQAFRPLRRPVYRGAFPPFESKIPARFPGGYISPDGYIKATESFDASLRRIQQPGLLGPLSLPPLPPPELERPFDPQAIAGDALQERYQDSVIRANRGAPLHKYSNHGAMEDVGGLGDNGYDNHLAASQFRIDNGTSLTSRSSRMGSITLRSPKSVTFKRSMTNAPINSTISRDNTAGENARQAELLAHFGTKLRNRAAKSSGFDSPHRLSPQTTIYTSTQGSGDTGMRSVAPRVFTNTQTREDGASHTQAVGNSGSTHHNANQEEFNLSFSHRPWRLSHFYKEFSPPDAINSRGNNPPLTAEMLRKRDWSTDEGFSKGEGITTSPRLNPQNGSAINELPDQLNPYLIMGTACY